jgi:hypothetical protein
VCVRIYVYVYVCMCCLGTALWQTGSRVWYDRFLACFSACVYVYVYVHLAYIFGRDMGRIRIVIEGDHPHGRDVGVIYSSRMFHEAEKDSCHEIVYVS